MSGATAGEKPAHVVKVIESQMAADKQASAIEVWKARETLKRTNERN